MESKVLEDLRCLRVDQVGSLLRPPILKSAFVSFLKKISNKQELYRVQNRCIRDLIATQEAHQLPVLTDGEFRRLNFMESFGEVAGMDQWKARWADILQALEEQQIEEVESTLDPPERGADPVLSIRKPVNQKLQLVKNRPLGEYLFSSDLTDRPVKITLIGADRIVQGYDYQNSRSIYSDIDEFLVDVVSIERQIVGQLVEAGCRYIQIDEPAYTRYVDERSLEAMRSWGEDPSENLNRSIQADNEVIEEFSGAIFGLHLCRGNRQSMWHREGAYDKIAEILFNNLNHHRFLLEYDTERAGGFEPLRFVPKNKMVVLGLITTKMGKVETVDELKRRIEEATQYIPVEQLALSPQCGFASNLPGNLLSQDDQWRKLDVMLETADQVWGTVG